MGLVDSFKSMISGSVKREQEQPSGVAHADLTAPRYGGDLISIFGYPSNNALCVAAVYRCVNLLADSVANLPLRYMRLKNGIFEDNTESRLHYLLHVQPDAHLSAVDFWRQVVQNILLDGNAYIVPMYDPATMELYRLALADPTAVSHDTINDTYTINDLNAGISGTFGEADIIHIKNYTRDGKRGLSTLGYARQVIGIAAAGDRETLDRFKNGGSVRGIVSNDTTVRGFGEYQDAELQKTAADIDGRFRAGARIVATPGQVQFNQMSLSSTDMQFLETRKFSVIDICRFFGVHPSFVFEESGSNYKSAEMANVAFLSNTLNPLLRKIETEFLRKLVPPSLCCKRKIEFDRRGVYANDLESRVKYQSQTIAAGIYTVNEWRKEENQPAVNGGDKVLVSANLKPLNS